MLRRLVDRLKSIFPPPPEPLHMPAVRLYARLPLSVMTSNLGSIGIVDATGRIVAWIPDEADGSPSPLADAFIAGLHAIAAEQDHDEAAALYGTDGWSR